MARIVHFAQDEIDGMSLAERRTRDAGQLSGAS
jgi:hypothetical protein